MIFSALYRFSTYCTALWPADEPSVNFLQYWNGKSFSTFSATHKLCQTTNNNPSCLLLWCRVRLASLKTPNPYFRHPQRFKIVSQVAFSKVCHKKWLHKTEKSISPMGCAIKLRQTTNLVYICGVRFV